MSYSSIDAFGRRKYEYPIRCPMDAIEHFINSNPFAPIYLDEASPPDWYEYRYTGELQAKGAEFCLNVILADDCLVSIVFPQVWFSFALAVAENFCDLGRRTVRYVCLENVHDNQFWYMDYDRGILCPKEAISELVPV